MGNCDHWALGAWLCPEQSRAGLERTEVMRERREGWEEGGGAAVGVKVGMAVRAWRTGTDLGAV